MKRLSLVYLLHQLLRLALTPKDAEKIIEALDIIVEEEKKMREYVDAQS